MQPCRDPTRPRVVIIGGGFGGLTVARSLRTADVDVLLLDRTNHHVFQPLLYQVATAALSPGDIASPLRSILRAQRNVTVHMAEVTAVDLAGRSVVLGDGERVPYDHLVLAPGSRQWYFGRDEWEPLAPGLKTLADALEIRERLVLSLEQAERVLDRPEARKFLTFVVVGGGPTGVELAGALAEIGREVVTRDFSGIRPEQFQVVLVEGMGHLLPAFAPELRAKAETYLKELGVTLELDTRVAEVTPDGVRANGKIIEAATVIWAAGSRASPLAASLGVALDAQGRVVVGPDLAVPGHPGVFVIGDAASCDDGHGRALPPLAPVAMQQGRYVARLIRERRAAEDRPPFRYLDRGIMTTVGKGRALAELGGFRFSGLIAWLVWSLVHIFFLIGFRNRIRVMTEWIWYYFTYKPGSHLIYWKLRNPRSASRPE